MSRANITTTIGLPGGRKITVQGKHRIERTASDPACILLLQVDGEQLVGIDVPLTVIDIETLRRALEHYL